MASSSSAAAERKRLEATIKKSFAEAKAQCKEPWVLAYANPLPNTSITFKQVMTIVAGAALLITIGLCSYLIAAHLRRWTRPREQKQIVRILLYAPIYSLVSFFSVWFDHSASFLAPIGQWAGGFALNSLFLFYIEIARPDGPASSPEKFFENLERRLYSGKKKHDEGSLRWFRGLNIMEFQLFFSRIGVLVASEVLYSLVCPLAPARSTGQTAILVIQGFSTFLAVYACILLERRLRPKMQEHSALFKLFSFKLVVGLDTLQTVIFPTLAERRVFTPSPPWHVSWNDFALCIPPFLLCIELAVCATTFLWAFDFAHYGQLGPTAPKSPLAALMSVFNIGDIWGGVAYAFWGRVPSNWTVSAGHPLQLEAVQTPESAGDDPTKVRSSSDG